MSDTFDFKKEYRDLYLPPKKPVIIDIPEITCIAVDGSGNVYVTGTLAGGANLGGAAGRLAEAYPTGALAEFTVGVPWRAVAPGSGRLVRFLSPRGATLSADREDGTGAVNPASGSTLH